MAKCRFCDHENPSGVERCGSCGAWITQGTSTAADQPPADPPAPSPSDAPRPDAESLEGKVLALMEGRRKIEAVKLYRQATGTGLKEAKDAVEALAARHGVESKAAGCSAAVLLLAVAAALLRWAVC